MEGVEDIVIDSEAAKFENFFMIWITELGNMNFQ